MRKICLFLLVLFLCFNAQAQLVQIENETFEGTLTGWTISPSNSWTMDTNLYEGGHTSYKGIVPMTNNQGDTSIITSPVYDLQSYAYVWLKFSHICKISASDICQIEYREDNLSSKWQVIPVSAYKGSGSYNNARFSHKSYADWQQTDSLAIPTNTWWKTEEFEITDEVSYSKVQFRFKITRGNILGTYFVYGWLIDNFQITASVNQIASPVVEFITNFGDTVNNTGPFTIIAKAASRTIAPMLTPTLYYSATYKGITTKDSIIMSATEGDSIWTCKLPQFVFESMVEYNIVASDSVKNIDSAYGKFYVKRPEGVVYGNSVALLSIENPSLGTLGGVQAVKVSIKNKGMANLDSCNINWMVNGILQVPVVWKGHLPEDFNDTLIIGYYTQRYNMFDTVEVWVSMPNGVIDTATSDDSMTVVSFGCYASISGDFVVGSGAGADVVSISDAFFIGSRCGVSGNITLKLQNGIYNENWDFSNLSNIMGNYTLTITSLSGNRDSVMLRPISGVGVVLNNTNNLIIKDISIDNTGSVTYGVRFTGAARNIEFRNVHFIGSITGTSSTNAPSPIYKASGSGVVDDIRFIGNLIEGGYYGIYFYGGTSATAYGTNIVMDSNIITNQYYYATYFYYNDFISFSHNTLLSRTANTYTYWLGMYFYYCNFDANGNKILQRSNAIIRPSLASLNYISNNTTVPSVFSNNELIGNSTTTYYGIYANYSNKLIIVNNSVYMSGTGQSRCLHIVNNTSASYEIKNNIFVNDGTGYPIYFSGTTTTFTSDYNCFYGNSNVGYFSSARTTLTAWQTATGKDVHSVEMNPSFTNVSSSLKLNHFTGLDCYRYSNISYDIEGTFRSLLTYMGCYTAPMVGSNAALVEILNIDNPAYHGDTSGLEIVILNSGLNTIQAATFNWSINNVLQPTVNWSGNLTSKSYDTLTLGNIIYQSGYNEIVVWLTSLGTLTDSIPFDDSLKISMYVCVDSISGDFIVGNAPGADYTSVNDVFFIANLCGVKGDINVKLQNGVYVENWNIIDLANQIGNYSLNITSLSGNKDSVIVRSTSGDVVVFKNTNNVNISNITIDAADSGNYAVNFTGRSSNITFENCNLYANPTSTATTYGVIYKSSASGLLDGLTIRKCNINGGYYGVYIYGSASAYDVNITIDSNTFLNQYYYGIYLYYVNSKTTSYNKISPRIESAGANWYGIWVMYNRNGGNIISNRIFADNASITTNLYGIRAYYIDTAMIANNEIYLNSKANTTYGIYLDYPIAVECVHNSVLLVGTANNARALYWKVYNNNLYDATLKNNILISKSSGSNPYAIYLDGTYSSSVDRNYRIDYNNYYSSNNLAYVAGGAKSDLTSWQSIVKTDRNSVNVYPFFIDSSLNLKLKNYSQLLCSRYDPINYDINHSNRMIRTAMGCYTPEIESVNGALLEVLNWKSMGYLGDSSHIKVVFYNFGSTNITSATIDWKFNTISQPSIHWTGNLALEESDTIELDPIFYNAGANELMVWINNLGLLNDTSHFDDTVSVSNLVCDSMLNGYYTIGSTGDFSDMDEAVDVLNLCGINGPVTFAIQPGTYYQNTTIGYINGSSPTNTITFTSSTTGDSSDVVLQRADDATSSLAPIMIANGENIILKDLTLSGLGTFTYNNTYSHGIIIKGKSRNIEIKNCHILVPKDFSTAITGDSHNPIRIMDTVSDVRIINNLIEGGSCGVYMYGVNSTTRTRNIVVKENTIGEVDNYGIYMYYVDSSLIVGNLIKQRTGSFAPGYLYGIYAYYANCDMLSNRIQAVSFNHAIYAGFLNDPSRLSLIANNEIIGKITGTSYRGMYFLGSSCAKIYQNSMYLEGTVAVNGLAVQNSATSYIDIKNNNLIINSTGNGCPIFLTGTTYIGTQWFIDYNNYYNANGINIGYAGGAGGYKTSMTDWKNAVSTDNHSVNVYPKFVDLPNSLWILDSMGISCPMITDVPQDILGNVRTTLTTIGSYQFSPARIDVLPSAFISPLSKVTTGVNTPIQVVITNNGLDTINSFMIGYEINGTVGTPYSWSGILLPGDTTSVQISSFTPVSHHNTITTITYLPNGQPDQLKFNDTLIIEPYGCDSVMYGTYSIGASGNFATIDDAIKTVENCGISASVVFEIQSGTYTDELLIGPISGSNQSSTITFVSQTRNAADVIINVENTALRLDHAANMNFEYLTIFGSVIGVELLGTCENIEFYRCTLATDTTTDLNTYRAVNYTNSSGSGKYLRDVRFIGNTISGGYYNMYLLYPSSSTSNMSNCLITIDSNILVNAYAYGIYSYNYGKYKSISYNTIRTRSVSATQYALYFGNSNTVDAIVGNRMYVNSTANAYGMYFNYYLNVESATNPALISNNIIRIPQSSMAYGIYLIQPMVKIYHNTILLNGSGTKYALYINNTTSVYQITAKNNIFATLGSGTGYPIYAVSLNYTTQAGGTILDFNNYYSSGPNVGYAGGAITSLAALQTSTGQNINSINLNPNFIDSIDLSLADYSGFECQSIPSVPRDINNYLRFNTTYMGANVIKPSSKDAALTSIVGFDTISAGYHPVGVVISNLGLDSLHSATITVAVNNVGFTPIIYTPTKPLAYSESDTVSLGSFTFNVGINDIMIVVQLTGDTLFSNDTVRNSRYLCFSTIGGDYVIGSSPAADYPTVDSLMADIFHCGISSDITLKFESRTYTGSWDLSNLGYFLQDYTLTVTSLANHCDSVVFKNTSGTLVSLSNTHNVVVKHITLDATAGTYALEFTGDASNIVLDSCKILVNPTSTTSTCIYKASSSSSLNYVTIKNSLIDGGFYGIYIQGSSVNYARNITIDNNVITNQYNYGIYLSYVNTRSISYNQISSRNVNAGADWYGMYLNYNRNGGNIIGNRIYSNSQNINSTIYGIRTINIDTALVANNDIYLNSNANTTNGIYIEYPRAVSYLHNSVLISGKSNLARAVYWYVFSNANYNATMKNNIFITNTSALNSYAIYLDGSYSGGYASSYGIDYNNYYSTGYLGYVNAAQATLSNWKNVVVSDTHSTNFLPTFIDVTQNLKIDDYSAYLCPLINDITYDRENISRHTYTAKGAYEVFLFDLDASLKDLDSTNLVYNQPSPVKVRLMNSGVTTLNAATLHWSFNGVAQTPYPWTGSLITFASSIVNLGNVTPLAGMNHIVVWLSNPNNSIDTNNMNDTLYSSIYVCTGAMSGVYTVGNTLADFISVEDAVYAMNVCGISSNVTLSLLNGTYDRLSFVGVIKGANDTAIVTISSNSSHPDSVVFEGNPALTLLNTSYLTFKNITFDSRTGGYAVLINGNTNNVEINHCNIYANPTDTSNSSAGIYKGSGTGIFNNVRVIGNTIDGGYYGIYFNGGTSISAYGENIVIDSNIMSNQYYFANLLNYCNLNSVSHNEILSRTSNTSTNWYGLQFNACNFIANGNKIYQKSTSITSPNLVYFTSGGYNNVVPSLFSNNEIIGYSSTSGSCIYVGTASKVNVYNNSIYMYGSGTSRSVYVANSSASSLNIKNNIIVNASTQGYPIYFVGSTTPYTSDYNCLYGAFNIGYMGSALTTLAAWQTATSQDAHSISINPPFINVNNNLELTDYSAFIVPKLSNVDKDINGVNRSTLTIMGAYSIPLFEGYNLELTEIISPKNVEDIYCFADYSDVKVVVSNTGTNDFDFSVNNYNLHLEVSGAVNYQMDTIISSGSLSALIKDTITFTNMLPVSMLGIYHVAVYLSSVVDTVYTDDTLRNDYTVSKIQLPYDVDFSTRPTEFVFKQVLGSVNWEVKAGTGSNPIISPSYGSGRLHFASESGEGSIAQAILNGIDLRGSNQPSLEFWFAHDNISSKTDFVAIKVSTDGGATTQTLHTVYRYNALYVTPGWEHIVIDLSAYTKESCLSLIFEASSFGGGNQNIDRIYISSKPDIAVSLIAPKEEDLVACKTSNQSSKVIISNLNIQDIDFDSDTSAIHIEITGTTVDNYTYPLSGILTALSNDTIEITHNFDLSNNGTYSLIAYIDAIDSNFVNDTAKVSIIIDNDLSIGNITGVDTVNCKQIGDSVYVSFTVYNLGNLVVDEIPILLQINGFNEILDTVYTSLMPGDSLLYVFTEPYIVPVVTYIQPYYFVKVQTQLACDAANANNIREIMACVDLPEIVDLQIQAVHKPLETVCDTGLRTVYVSVTLANEGTSDISSAVLHVEIDSAGTPWASFSETTDAIPSEGTTTHTFSQGYIVPNFTGNYIVRVYVDSLPADENLTNDSLEILACAILDDVSIDAFGQVSWTMEQNIPNPARTNTRIPYAIPQEGAILFKVMSINGQVLYTKEIDAMAGSHSMEFDITILSNGIYYYSMEYHGQRIVKKMTIQK